ncbi:MAG: zinc dependent phospholipase C family protein [Spirochaetaceae bacterium]
MPSHIAHLLFAEDVLRSALPGLIPPGQTDVRSALLLGAQGPDLFLHNRHRRPSGLHYGIVLHSKGSGTFCASLLEFGLSGGEAAADSKQNRCLKAYTAGYMTHIALDRTLHPYINVHAGWREPRRPETYGYHLNHVFLERIIDTYLAMNLRGVHPRHMQVWNNVNLTGDTAKYLLKAVAHAVFGSTRRGSQDPRLHRKIMNAYRDSTAYYAAIHDPDLLGARRRLQQSKTAIPAWLRFIHPLSLPADPDLANEARRPWRDPCSGAVQSSESVLDLYWRAHSVATDLLKALEAAWAGDIPIFTKAYRNTANAGDPLDESDYCAGEGLEGLIGNGDLSDSRREGGPCRRVYMDVFDFSLVLRHAAQALIDATEEDARP